MRMKKKEWTSNSAAIISHQEERDLSFIYPFLASWNHLPHFPNHSHPPSLSHPMFFLIVQSGRDMKRGQKMRETFREWENEKEEERSMGERRERKVSSTLFLFFLSLTEFLRLIKMYTMIRHSSFLPIVGSWCCRWVCMSCTARGVGTKRVSLFSV